MDFHHRYRARRSFVTVGLAGPRVGLPAASLSRKIPKE
jgi:hypothetical protein